MKRLLVPLILLLVGVGGGVGAGFYFAPEPVDIEMAESNPCGDPVQEAVHTAAVEVPEEREYAKLNNQFIIPVLKEGRVTAMVVLSLNLEVVIGERTAVFASEPKLRDAFLQAMFDHANSGGFSGNFTSGENMRTLRNDLLRRAHEIVGEQITDVLILDIVRQDQ